MHCREGVGGGKGHFLENLDAQLEGRRQLRAGEGVSVVVTVIAVVQDSVMDYWESQGGFGERGIWPGVGVGISEKGEPR